MSDLASSDERLPWLDTAPAPPRVRPAMRRSRRPILLLLALLIGAAIAVMAFLAGRVTAPAERSARIAAPVDVRLPAATPVRIPPAVPTLAPPPPSPSVSPTPARATPGRAVPAAVREPRPRRASRLDRRGVVPRIERAFPLAPLATAASPRPSTAPRPPSASRPARPAPRAAPRTATASRGGVVQLGAYVTMPLLDSAWARLVAADPALGTMPRMVTGTALPGRPYYYRLRVAAGSRRDARLLCDHLHRIGRGCMVIAAK